MTEREIFGEWLLALDRGALDEAGLAQLVRAVWPKGYYTTSRTGPGQKSTRWKPVNVRTTAGIRGVRDDEAVGDILEFVVGFMGKLERRYGSLEAAIGAGAARALAEDVKRGLISRRRAAQALKRGGDVKHVRLSVLKPLATLAVRVYEPPLTESPLFRRFVTEHQAAKSLSIPQRAVLSRLFARQPQNEIAAALGISQPAVSLLRRQIVKILRAALADQPAAPRLPMTPRPVPSPSRGPSRARTPWREWLTATTPPKPGFGTPAIGECQRWEPPLDAQLCKALDRQTRLHAKQTAE
jgi:hypothetical protein